MPNEHSPHILVIDDSDDKTIAVRLEQEGLSAAVLHPDDVNREDVTQADVVLVDYQLDDWQRRDEAEFTLRPRDGIALGTLLRRQIHDRGSPTAFALRTGHLDALASPLPPESQNHILAALNNFEWVFEKAHDGEGVAQIRSLAEAVRQLPQAWPPNDATGTFPEACHLLGLVANDHPDEVRDVMRCLPPLHSMSTWSHGLAFLRWLLHRILPYPCFLLDATYLAARLRVSTQCLNEIEAVDTSPLSSCRYQGLLHDFLGKRWWRSRVEQAIWTATAGNSLDGDAIRAWLAAETDAAVEPAATDDFPVICRDAKLRALKDAFPITECVRIQPDDWPAYADQAWTTRELAKCNPSLTALIVNQSCD